MKINGVIICILLVVYSCTSDPQQEIRTVTVIGAEERESEIPKWTKEIIENGDSVSYDKILVYFMVKGNECDEGLAYSKIMAYKYDYGPAFYRLYSCHIRNRNLDPMKIDSSSADLKIAMEFLEKASQANVEKATVMLVKIKAKLTEEK